MTKHIHNIIQRTRAFPAPILLAQACVGFLISIFSFAHFYSLRQGILSKDITVFDTVVWETLVSLRSPVLTHFMVIISFIGAQLTVVFTIAVTLIFLKKQLRREAFLFPFAYGSSLIVNLLFKMRVQRLRPYIDPLVIEHDYSFPSAHAMTSFVCCMTLTYFMYQLYRNKLQALILFGCAASFTSLVGISRVYLGVHYASDVIGGYIAGFWWVITIISLEKAMDTYKVCTRPKLLRSRKRRHLTSK